MRINEHPILVFNKGKKIKFYFDNKEIEGFEDEPIAVSLYANNLKTLSYSIKRNRPRGVFCCIGNCSSCLMKVNGIPNVRTCTKRVEENMLVETPKRRTDIEQEY